MAESLYVHTGAYMHTDKRASQRRPREGYIALGIDRTVQARTCLSTDSAMWILNPSPERSGALSSAEC